MIYKILLFTLILLLNLSCDWVDNHILDPKEEYYKFSCKDKEYSFCIYYELSKKYWDEKPNCKTFENSYEDKGTEAFIPIKGKCKNENLFVKCNTGGEEDGNYYEYYYNNFPFINEKGEEISKDSLKLDDFYGDCKMYK